MNFMNKNTKTVLALLLIGLAISCKQASSSEEATEAAVSDEVSKSEDKSSSETSSSQNNQIQAGQITAGEWNDLKNWSFWENLNSDNSEYSEMDTYWKYNLENRVSVNVKNNNKNLVDVSVQLIDSNDDVIWESKTDNKGNAELWASMKNSKQSQINDLKIRIGSKIFDNIKINKNNSINKLVVFENSNENAEKKVDIAFMVDATGSMGDEIDYLKAELNDVISKIKEKNPNTTINTGTVFYRDNGDQYITKKSDFTTNFNQTIDFIKEQSADGGGDFPEAVDEALDQSIDALQWSDKATSRLLFLVLDAPPHYDEQVIERIHKTIALASRKGIKIIPIVASGIDKETEFIMRYAAITTNGTYVFITDDSGIGNEHLVPTVGQYQIEFLNNIIERIINQSIE
jgi:hypothetical protein